MVKHIVIWKLKEEYRDKASLLKQELEALNGQIPELIKLEAGIDFSDTETSGDLVLYSEFATKEDLEVYQKHPKHQAVGVMIRELVCERKMADYIV